ncbi:MAG: GEVED domain-containing protein [Lysobacteraceae bacterium]
MKASRKWVQIVRASTLRSGYGAAKSLRATCVAAVVACACIATAHAAQVQHLNTQTATATGAGAAGTPTIASFSIPSGKNRVLFIWPTFERDHCSDADVAGGLCVNGNIISTGLGDNFPEPRIGTPPATTSNNQLTARVVGPGGTINKQNALTIGGTPSGDTRFIVSSTLPSDPDPVNPPDVPTGSAFFSLSSFHIVLFEDEINTLLGGAASGTVSITLPDANLPSNAGDDALLIASVYQNVEQTPTGFVRNGTGFGQAVGGIDPAGNYTMTVAAYDAGQAPNEADDGKLVMGANGTTDGFNTPAGHVVLAALATTNAGGNYDTPNGGVTNEPNGMSGGAWFRNGGATPADLYALTSAGTATPAVYGGTTTSFLLESDNADVGDAPISYGNPTHTLSGIRLGASVDADASLLNNATATGDDLDNTDDEDGVTLTPLLPTGETTIVPTSIQNGSGFLNVWFDWNADGDFNDAGEQMIANQAVAVGVTNLNIAVPITAVIGPTFARFRVCTNNAALDNCATPAGTVQSGEVEDYQFTVSRKLLLRKTTLGGVGGAFGYTLTNTVQTTGTVTTTVVNTPTQVDGDTASTATLAYTIVSPTTAVTVNEDTLPAGWQLTGATCVNAAGSTVGSLTGSTYTLTGAEIGASVSFTCTFTNTKLPILRLQKALPTGRFVATDQFALTIAGTGGPATVTTTGVGATANGIVTLSPGALGAVYTLSEAGAAGALLTNYTTTYACTNALAGGQTPGGSGTSFSITAVAGDDLTCTLTNTRNSLADLRLTKTNTPGVNGEVDQAADTVVSGTTINYTLIVSNLGPDAADGSVLADPAPTGLTCTTASCTATGGAVCPVPTGAALVTALQGAGTAIPTLPNGGSVTVTLTCTVQ